MNDVPRVFVRSAEPDPADPFAIPAISTRLTLRDASTGSDPLVATSVALYHDDTSLHIVFIAEDDEVRATLTEHDADLYTEDVVEIFLAPRDLTTYFEIEVNPLGTTFDARVDSPAGDRRSMKADRGWECEGLRVAVDREPGADHKSVWRCAVAIPFASLGEFTPESTKMWRANFFRIDRSTRGDEYSAWSPTFRNPADFHVPSAFGFLRMSFERAPKTRRSSIQDRSV